ncbi:hypothetical protein LCGC14_2406190, partial [marine sediment metagenome]
MDQPYLQRRYLLSFDTRDIGHIFTDVLIIGTGAAGMRAALAAAESAQVIAVTKGELRQSNTYDAQGGIAVVTDGADDVSSHIADTIKCAGGIGDEDVIRRVISAGPEAIEEVISWGLPVDTEGGSISLGREGGHSADRIIHAHGDATGKHLAETLIARVAESDNIKIFESCYAVDLVTDDEDDQAVMGAVTFHPRYGLQMIWARQTILAGGGAGMLWRETTNPPSATGDAIALAFRAGAELADLEMMQFHPTTLYNLEVKNFLITEAVRGDGEQRIDDPDQAWLLGELIRYDTSNPPGAEREAQEMLAGRLSDAGFETMLPGVSAVKVQLHLGDINRCHRSTLLHKYLGEASRARANLQYIVAGIDIPSQVVLVNV